MNPNNCDACGHDKNMCQCPAPGDTIIPSANEIQVGGDHYKGDAYQHWDWIADCNIGYLAGCATKYIVRHKKKNGKQDLDKAIHFVQKLTEGNGKNLSMFADANEQQHLHSKYLTDNFILEAKVDIEQAICLRMLAQYENRGDLCVVLNILRGYTLACYPSMPPSDARCGAGAGPVPMAPTPSRATGVDGMRIDSRTPWGMEEPRGYKGDD